MTIDTHFTLSNVAATAATSVFAWITDVPPLIFLGIGVVAQLTNLYWTWKQKRQEWEHREELHDAAMAGKKNGATQEGSANDSKSSH